MGIKLGVFHAIEEAVIARSAALQTANAIYRRRDASSGSRATVSVSFQKRTTVAVTPIAIGGFLFSVRFTELESETSFK